MSTSRKCKHCGSRIPSTLRRDAIYCSADCRKAAGEKKRREDRPIRLCLYCGESIDVAASGKSYSTRYCSAKCKRDSKVSRDRERYAQQEKTSPKERKAERRQQHLQRKYGISPGEYAELLDAQHGECAICRKKAPPGDTTFHLDHDHKSGRIRGILCPSCNLGIGSLGDDPTQVRAALIYLRFWEEADTTAKVPEKKRKPSK